MNKYIVVTTTFDNRDEANKIIELLLKKRLVSCCQLLNITSSYHWNGSIEHTCIFPCDRFALILCLIGSDLHRSSKNRNAQTFITFPFP